MKKLRGDKSVALNVGAFMGYGVEGRERGCWFCSISIYVSNSKEETFCYIALWDFGLGFW